MEKQRARSEQQKDERRNALLRATQNLFERTSYETVTMSHVAQTAGLAKGTVFFYFKTKEELFLALFQQLLQAWSQEVETGLSQLAPGSPVSCVATLFTHSLEHHSTLTRLFVITHTTLENNVEYEAMWNFKQWLSSRMTRIGSLLEHCL